MYEVAWFVMNSVGATGEARMRFIMPFSLSCVKDCATIIMRNIDAKVNMPGVMKSSADACLTSTRDTVCSRIGLCSAFWFGLTVKARTCWMMGGTACVATSEPSSRYIDTVVLIHWVASEGAVL